MKSSRKNQLLVLVSSLAVLIVFSIGYIFFMRSRDDSLNYKAIFISNGQVYFGKIDSRENADPLVLRNVYYPQVQAVTQAAGSSPIPTQQPQLQLVKMGNETHGPKDEIRFNRIQVLYIEDLKDDGVVVKSIRAFEANGRQPTPGMVPATN